MKARIMTALIILVAFATAPASAIPINAKEGFTAYKGQWIIRNQVRIHLRDNDPTTMNREMTVIKIPTTFVYGLTSRLTAIGTVPYVSKNLDFKTSGRRRGDAAIGDVSLLAKYRLWTKDEPGARTMRLSVLTGLSLPTGPNDASDALGRLPRTLQLGRGTTDPILGLTATRWTPFWAVTGDAIFRRGGSDEGYEFGNSFRYDLEFERAIWPRELPEEGFPDYLYAVIELNGEVADHDRFQGVRQDNTGSHILYASPGLQFVTTRYAVEASVQVPILTDMNGLQPEPKATFILSNRITW